MKKMISTYQTVIVVAALIIAGTASRVDATELQDICTVGGQSEIQLSGVGLVVGLSGTGDGGTLPPTAVALLTYIEKMKGPKTELAGLKNAKNVALVMVQVVVPKSGLTKGQKLDCHITSLGAAKSLRGGRLMWAPLQQMGVRQSRGGSIMVAEASGAVNIEDATILTTGLVPKGATLKVDVQNHFVDETGKFKLLLKPSHRTFQVTNEVADVVNRSEFAGNNGEDTLAEESMNYIAKSINVGVIEVTIPSYMKSDPVKFISEILDLPIYDPHDQARVIVNSKVGGVIVTGEVEISPIAFSHKSISVVVGDTGDGQQIGSLGTRTIPAIGGYNEDELKEDPRIGGQLADLQKVLNDLQVSDKDLIDILRMLDASGKLHAEFIEQ